jgi:chorismate mutase / prephenate dehydratase
VSLEKLRKRIDAIDDQVVNLLNERARCAREIGNIKRSDNAPIYVPEREYLISQKLIEKNGGPLTDDAIRNIYREIISAIRALEKKISVAFLGPRDTFSHEAAMRVFGAEADYRPLPSFSDIFSEVEHGRIDYGVVPVESSMGGAVSDTLDNFIVSELKIIKEFLLRVSQNLLAKCPQPQIRRVYSKDNALIQCHAWLQAHLPGVEQIKTSSTAEAAIRATTEEGSAAIASMLAAQTYNLPVVAEKIEDAAHNFTRFFVLGNQMTAPTGNDKTSLLIPIHDRPGALYRLLKHFADNGINLTRIESRPSRQKAWEYVFFIDLLGHAEDTHIKAALKEVSGEIPIKVLGSFPRDMLQAG